MSERCLTNDGLLNASDLQKSTKNESKSHEEMLARLENALKKHPKTKFIAAQLSNFCDDLSFFGFFFDKSSFFFMDISARYSEIAPIPKFAHECIEKYQDRIVYGLCLSDKTLKKLYRDNAIQILKRHL